MADKVPSPVRLLISWTRGLIVEIGKFVRDPLLFNAMQAELGLKTTPISEDKIKEVNEQLAAADGKLAAADVASDEDLSLDESVLEFLMGGRRLAEIAEVVFTDRELGGRDVGDVATEFLAIMASERMRMRGPAWWAGLRFIMLGYEKAEEVPRFDPSAIFDRLTGNKTTMIAGGFGATELIGGLLVPPAVIGLNWLIDKLEHSPETLAQLPNGTRYVEGNVDYKLGWEPDPDTAPDIQQLLARALTVRIEGEHKVKGEDTAASMAALLTMMALAEADGGPGFVLRAGADFSLVGDISPRGPIKRSLDIKCVGVGGADFLWHLGRKEFKRLGAAEGNPKLSGKYIASGTEDFPTFRFGKPGRSRFDIVGLQFGAELSENALAVTLGVKGGKVLIYPKELVPDLSDIFSAMGAEKFEARFDGTLKLDGERGLSFEGEAGLKARVLSNLQYAGARLDYLDLGLGVKDKKLKFDALAAGRFSIGPFTASIDRFGFAIVPTEGGFEFLPPKGIGLKIDAAAIKGGGFLMLDYEAREFAGAFELTLMGFSVKAIAILSAGGPGTDAGFALFVMVYARFPGGLELGLRFTLNAIGGMIGINHVFNRQALEKALPSGAMDDILFPADPVGDAPRIISSLKTIFPVRKGAWTIGLMAEVGWGSDYFCSLRLGIVIPLGEQFDPSDQFRYFYILGRISVVCFEHVPKPIRLQLICDFIGEIGVSSKWGLSLSFYGRLRDSRFGPTAIEGAIAFSVRSGPNARFLIAAGGFHPGFKRIPEDLPSPIDRIGTNYDIGVIKAWMRAYFAVASGTLQFGLELGCRYKLGPIAFTAELGFDALIHLSPFSFEAGCRASAALTFRGHELLGVHLNLTVWGPDRWRIKGHGEITILFWDVSVDVDESWGDEVAIAQQSLRLDKLVIDDLRNDSNWRFELPGPDTMVSFAPVTAPADSRTMLAHPLAGMSYSQRRIPFGIALQRVSFCSIEGASFFPVPQITSADDRSVAGVVVLKDEFAVPEFLNLSDEQKLSQPSFETLPSGVAAGASGYQVEQANEVEFEYELIFSSSGNSGLRFKGMVELEAVGLSRLLSGEAAARSAMRPFQARRAGIDPVVTRPAAWVAADRSTLQASESALAAEWMATSAVAVAAAAGPTLQGVEDYELAR